MDCNKLSVINFVRFPHRLLVLVLILFIWASESSRALVVNGYTIGPNANLYSANLIDANLSNANLYGANLSYATLFNANLSNSIFNTNTVWPSGYDFLN